MIVRLMAIYLMDASVDAFSSNSLLITAQSSYLCNIHRRSSNCRSFDLHDTASKIQSKRDFLGSLENAYDFNYENPASTLFLDEIVDGYNEEEIARFMIDSFDMISVGSWRTVYAQEFSTSFGFGGLFGEAPEVEFEFGNDGSITCK